MSEGLLPAMLAVQAEAPTLPKNATNPHFKSKYAPLDTIVETVGPLLAKHGLVWSTKPSYHPETGAPTLKYKVAHAPTGESDEGEMPLLLSKNDAQGQGSAITYARRYALCAVFNLVADDDDDGARAASSRAQSAPTATRASSKQLGFLKNLLKRQKVNTKELRLLLQKAGVEVADAENPVPMVEELTPRQASSVIDQLQDKPVPTGESDAPADTDDFKGSES